MKNHLRCWMTALRFWAMKKLARQDAVAFNLRIDGSVGTTVLVSDGSCPALVTPDHPGAHLFMGYCFLHWADTAVAAPHLSVDMTDCVAV